MPNYTITIHISPDDVDTLIKGKYVLYCFKAIASNGVGGFPIWYKLDTSQLSTQIVVDWIDEFKAYNSVSKIENGEEIFIGNSLRTELGYIIDIDKYGNLSSSSQGFGDLIAFRNNSNIEYTVGFTQTALQSNGKENIVCAFYLFGNGAARVFTPVNKVALIFSSENFQMGTVIERAMSGGILVDLDGADNNNREINFSVNNGWASNNYPWVKNFNYNTDMSLLLTDNIATVYLEDIWIMK